MSRKEGKEMGFSSKGMETRKKGAGENKKVNEEVARVFPHIERRVDEAASKRVRQHEVLANLFKEKTGDFEVKEREVVVAMKLSDQLDKSTTANTKPLLRW